MILYSPRINLTYGLIRANIVQLIDAINDQVETDGTSRSGVNSVYDEIGMLKHVLRVLRMNFVADMVDQSLPAEPDADTDEALSQAAGVLFRMNKEVCSKLDSMEREVFNSDRGITAADSLNSGQLQIQ